MSQRGDVKTIAQLATEYRQKEKETRQAAEGYRGAGMKAALLDEAERWATLAFQMERI
jgi:hypothetical protein